MITADYTKLHQDSLSSANDYFNNAVTTIDNCFGKWYAKENPSLVTKFMEITSKEYTEAVHMKSMEEMDEKYWKEWSEK